MSTLDVEPVVELQDEKVWIDPDAVFLTTLDLIPWKSSGMDHEGREPGFHTTKQKGTGGKGHV